METQSLDRFDCRNQRGARGSLRSPNWELIDHGKRTFSTALSR
jgi:hypothetical protein